MSVSLNPSLPPYRRTPERELSDSEREAFIRIADALIPPHDPLGSPSSYREYDSLLDRALAARGADFDEALAAATRLADSDVDDLTDVLRSASTEEPDAFHLVSSIVAGAYLMVPAVRREIGYPGQRRHPPQFDEAANQIMDGILDPVIERGSIYVPTDDTQA